MRITRRRSTPCLKGLLESRRRLKPQKLKKRGIRWGWDFCREPTRELLRELVRVS